MKQISKAVIIPFIILALIAFAQVSFAADPPPPPPPGEHGATGNKAPLNGPITGGVVVFLAFGAGLAGWEISKARKQKKEETA